MPEKFNELLLKPDIIELYNEGITPDYGYLMNGRFEKDMIKTSYHLKTLSGNLISWEASYTEYLFPVVSLEPKQAGSGDPSPENVRPITGYDSLSLTRCGKNLLDAPANPSKNIYVWGRQDLYQNGQPLFPAGNYSFYTPFKFLQLQTLNEKGEQTGIWYSTTTVTITALESFYLRIDSGNAENDGNLATMCTGSTPTDYEPYQGDTYDIALPETVYGGTVDAVTGVGSKTWGYIASYNGESLPGEWISDRDVYSAGTTPTSGAQVAYRLDTPEPFQATGNRQLTSLVGYNTIYTTGDSITLSRKGWRLEA